MLFDCLMHSSDVPQRGLRVELGFTVGQCHLKSLSIFTVSCWGLVGVRQASQTFGALVGATIAATTFKLSGSNFIMTFALSALPAATALAVVFWVRPSPTAAATAQPVSFIQLQALCATIFTYIRTGTAKSDTVRHYGARALAVCRELQKYFKSHISLKVEGASTIWAVQHQRKRMQRLECVHLIHGSNLAASPFLSCTSLPRSTSAGIQRCTAMAAALNTGTTLNTANNLIEDWIHRKHSQLARKEAPEEICR